MILVRMKLDVVSFIVLVALINVYQAYFPRGPQNNVSLSRITEGGWKLCFSDTYNVPMNSSLIDRIKYQQCTKPKLMIGCRRKSSPNIILTLAWASRSCVFYDTGTNKHEVSSCVGTDWYFNRHYSWGFAKEGDEVYRRQCDEKTSGCNDCRLCWHTMGGNGGYRCGTTKDLNNNSNYERVIFQTGAVTTFPHTQRAAKLQIMKNVTTEKNSFKPKEPGTSDGNSTGAIVGCIIALFIIIVLVTSFVLMKRKNIGFQEIFEMIPRKRSDEACMEEGIVNPRNVSIDALLDNTFLTPSIEEFKELEEKCQKRRDIRSNLTMSQGKRYNNGKKGRFNINNDIIPYDQTRVKLKTPIKGIDYINASWIQRVEESGIYDDVYEFLPSEKINFLLTQDPTPDTEQHFYQMMYEQQVDIIVHVGSDKSLPKWNKLQFGNVSKKMIKRVQLDQNLIREHFDIFVKHKKSTINHPITAYHYTAWPTTEDFEDVDSKNFLTMMSLIKADIGKPTKEFTIASHDSSGGVEGASTFIILFQMLQDLNTKLNVRKLELGKTPRTTETEYVNIFEKVNEVRKQRAHMVSKFSNYTFLLTCLAHYAKNKESFDEIQTKFEKSTNKMQLSASISDESKNLINDDEDSSVYVYSEESEYVYSDVIEDPYYDENNTYTNDNIYVN